MPSDNLNYIEQAQGSPRYGTPPVSVGEGTNYVEYGCTVEHVDDTHLLATLRGGRIHRFTAGPPARWYVVDVDPRRDVQLEANATNEIYVVINGAATAKPTADVVVSTSGAPTALSLHVATIDTTSSPASVSDGMNRSPEIGTGTNPIEDINLSSRILIWGASGNLLGTLDPASSARPVQDSLDVAASEGGGRIELPPERITESAQLTMHKNTSLIGMRGASEIEITDPSADGLVFDTTQSSYSTGDFINGVEVGGFDLVGGGPSASGTAVVDNGMADCRFGFLNAHSWGGVVWHEKSGAASYQTVIDHLHITNCDAGGADGIIALNEVGAPKQFNYVSVYPTDSSSGVDSQIIHCANGGSLQCGVLNLGGSSGKIFDGLHGHTRFGQINFEPSTQNTTDHSLISIEGNNGLVVDSFAFTGSPTVKRVYDSFAGGNVRLASPAMDQATITGDVFAHLGGGQSGPMLYQGASSDVSTSESITPGIACLGDLTLLTS